MATRRRWGSQLPEAGEAGEKSSSFCGVLQVCKIQAASDQSGLPFDVLRAGLGRDAERRLHDLQQRRVGEDLVGCLSILSALR